MMKIVWDVRHKNALVYVGNEYIGIMDCDRIDRFHGFTDICYEKTVFRLVAAVEIEEVGA